MGLGGVGWGVRLCGQAVVSTSAEASVVTVSRSDRAI